MAIKAVNNYWGRGDFSVKSAGYSGNSSEVAFLSHAVVRLLSNVNTSASSVSREGIFLWGMHLLISPVNELLHYLDLGGILFVCCQFLGWGQ